MSLLRPLVAGAALSIAFVVTVLAPTGAGAAQPNVSSLSAGGVTIYGAKWCSACKSLERGLTDRKIAFELIDVDDNPAAFAKARAASGAGSAIPLSNVTTSTKTTWIVGADVEAVDRALKD